MSIEYLEGFEHQVVQVTGFDGTHGLWTYYTGVGSMSFPAGRTGVCFRVAATGTTSYVVTTDLPNTYHRVMSFYIRSSGNPSAETNIVSLSVSGGGTAMGYVKVTTGGLAKVGISSGTAVTGPDIVDGNWHRIDLYQDTSGTTWTLDWKVDGAAQTQATHGGHSATYCVRNSYGVGAVTWTVDLDDIVCGNAAGDYPINSGSDYSIYHLHPNADGTHNNPSGYIEDQAGVDIGTAWSLLNDVPYSTTDYVRQIGINSDHYAEIGFEDTSETNILAVAGVVFGGAANVSNPNGTIRMVDSGGTTLVDLFSGNMGGGSTTTRAVNGLVPDPGADGWSQGDLNGVKLRVGFSTNASPSATPRWTDALLQYVCSEGISIVERSASLSAIASVSAYGIPQVNRGARRKVVKSQATHRASRW